MPKGSIKKNAGAWSIRRRISGRASVKQDMARERQALLQWLQDWLEGPMLVLAFIWLALFVVESVWGLSPLLEVAGYVIWAVFLLDFALGLTLAPGKLDYLVV